MIYEIFDTEEGFWTPAIIGIFSVIPLIITFFKVLWRSIKSLFQDPSSNYLKEEEFPDELEQTLIEKTPDIQISAESETSKEHELKQSLIDPCGIMDQIEYFRFLEDPDVNHFCSFFRLWKCNAKMIPGFILLPIIIAYIVIDFYTSIQFKKNYVGPIIRMIIYLFSIPFLMIFNFTGIFMDNKKTKENHSFIRTIWILVSIGYMILIFVGIIFIIVCHAKFSTFIPQNLIYKNSTKSVKISKPASICEINYFGLNLIQYAGIAATGQSNDINLANEIVKYLFDGSKKTMIYYTNKFTFFYDVQINDQLSVVAFNSISDMNGVSFLLENYFNDFIPSKIFGAIIPFFELAHDLILARFMNQIFYRLTMIFGVPQITPNYIKSNEQIYKKINEHNITAVYTGHSIGGLLAKSVGANFDVPSVAFESLNYYHSLFDAGMIKYSNRYQSTTNGYQMVNVYSPSQLFAQVETNSTMNIKLPKWRSSLDYINPYELTCLIAAGCAVDDRYDSLCDSILGLDHYKHLFAFWNRTRSDLI